MATVTPNFNWPVPTSTDLVKDGATAIEALGDSIDASLVDLKGGTTGQVLSKTSNTDMDFTWVAADDTNAIQNTIVDAKGDLIAASAADTPARLAVGANGETLVADSSTSTGLRYQGSMAAGKNIFLNSDFSVWQRGTSFTNPANSAYVADRWFMYYDGSGATRTISQQTFTGDNPSGCNASYYLRFAQTVAGTGGSVANAIYNRIEDVREFNGQTVTISFWAKADASRTITLQTYQEFGTGGSGAVGVNTLTASVTTSWTRFSSTFAMPSVSGKTIASNSAISNILGFPLNAVGTFDITGIQLESGSVATAFQTATGTIQGELSACQRYYYRTSFSNGAALSLFGTGVSSTTVQVPVQYPVNMRTVPTAIDYGGGFRVVDGTSAVNLTSPTLSLANSTASNTNLNANGATGLTQYRPYALSDAGAGNAYYGISAEL